MEDVELAWRAASEAARKFGVARRRARVELVEVGWIVESVERCSAFDGNFLPTRSCTKERWERVYSAVREGRPPVAL